MLLASWESKKANFSDTKTYEDWSKFIGDKPKRFGIIASLYPELTASFLTDALRNVFYKDKKAGSFQSIDSMFFDWDVEVNNIKRVMFADSPVGDGANGTEITFAFTENYYQKYDIFNIDGSDQQVFVTMRPERKRDDYWLVTGRLVDTDYKSVLNADYCQRGGTTRFIGNAMPEMSEEGYVKHQSNISHFRNVITTHKLCA